MHTRDVAITSRYEY